MSRRGIVYLFGLGSIMPLSFFLARYHAGGKGSDFWAMYNAGKAVLSGSAVYGASTIFPYPPHSLFLFAPLSSPPFQVALTIFNFLGAGLFVWAARPFSPSGFPAFLAICTPAAIFCLYYGQTGLIVGGLWLLAFRARWWAVALLTFKPHLGVLSVLSLRNISALLYTSAAALLLVAGSVVVFGYQIWLDFFSALHAQGNLIGVRQQWNSIGISPAMHFGFAAWLVFAIAAAYLLSKKITAFTAATAALLIAPYSFLYDMPVASLGFALGMYSGWKDLRQPHRLALLFAFMSPCFVFWLPLAVPPLLLWALWVQVSVQPTQGESEWAGGGVTPRSTGAFALPGSTRAS